jgi:hypothetical protein
MTFIRAMLDQIRTGATFSDACPLVAPFPFSFFLFKGALQPQPEEGPTGRSYLSFV